MIMLSVTLLVECDVGEETALVVVNAVVAAPDTLDLLDDPVAALCVGVRDGEEQEVQDLRRPPLDGGGPPDVMGQNRLVTATPADHRGGGHLETIGLVNPLAPSTFDEPTALYSRNKGYHYEQQRERSTDDVEEPPARPITGGRIGRSTTGALQNLLKLSLIPQRDSRRPGQNCGNKHQNRS